MTRANFIVLTRKAPAGKKKNALKKRKNKRSNKR